MADKGELIADLLRLCAVFEHVEKLLIFAASVRHKLADAPRLCEAIFSDFYNYYLPKMGTGSSNICYDKVHRLPHSTFLLSIYYFPSLGFLL